MDNQISDPGRREAMKRTLAAAVGTAGYAAWPAAHAADSLKIGYLPVNVMLPLYSEKARFWSDAGLDVELFRAQGGPAILQALLAGAIPVGDIGIAPAVVAASRKLPLYFLTMASVCTPDHPLDRIMVRKDSPIKHFRDLKGKTLAIVQKGTQPDAALVAAEKVYGLKKSDINLLPVPYPNMAQVLDQKQVDAIYPFPPADTMAEVQFEARTIAETTDFIPYVGFTTLAVRRDYADANPAIIRKLVKGAILGQRWINNNAKDALAVANAALNIPPPIAGRVRSAYWSLNALPVMANVWHFYELQVAGGIIQPVPDVEAMMKSYFVDPVLKFTLPAAQELGMLPDPVVKRMLTASYPMLKNPAEAYHMAWDKELLKG
ncbi:MAG: ABC transporter substrate-binding protein [Burkholderiales bacterium]|nr:ABC transporter substrate-binding protein [Burkholderiales bacterium]